MSPRQPIAVRFYAVALLLILAWLQFSTLAVTSPTMDEPSHLVSGYAFLTRGDTRIKLNGPILNNLVGAIPLLLESGLELVPPDDPAWDANADTAIAEPFVWDNIVSPFRIMYLARFPFMAISWLLGALIFRWARERSGPCAGLFALALYVFCPNLLAHSRLVMTDFTPAACACLTLYTFDRSQRSIRRRVWTIAAGVALGLALAAKFSLVTLVIALSILAWINYPFSPTLNTASNARRILGRLVCILAIAGLTVWAIYAFQIGSTARGGVPVPAPGFWRNVESARYYLGQPAWLNYLFGQTSATGWWYYFPVAFLLKTPLPVLVLLTITLAQTFRRLTARRDLVLLLPIGLLFFSLLFSTNNVGYRYLLPILPLIFIYVSDLVACAQASTDAPRQVKLMTVHWIAAALLIWHIIGTLSIYPYYLAFFNEIAGGPDRGRYVLSDSNIDWGQDLVGLKQYVEEHHIDRIKLSYFGIAPPSAYGMSVEALSPVRFAMHDQGAWWLRRYYPPDPAPGVYAISVANLMGGIWIDQNAYAFFRDRAPDTTIGHSIYIYTIPARGKPVNLSLSGLQIDQIDLDTYARFSTNDVRPRWFDATTSLIAPPGETWIAVAARTPIAPELAELFAGSEPIARSQTLDDNQPYSLYRFDLSERLRTAADASEQMAGTIAMPVMFAETAELLGYRLETQPASKEVAVVSFWRAGDQIVTPLQLFVHAIGPDGQIIAQEDRLDAPAYGWREGDLIAQVNRMALPVESGVVEIEIGLYNTETGERLPILAGGREIDRRLLLQHVTLP